MMDDRQTIVNTVDGSDWSGAEPIKYYEADGKYYVIDGDTVCENRGRRRCST